MFVPGNALVQLAVCSPRSCLSLSRELIIRPVKLYADSLAKADSAYGYAAGAPAKAVYVAGSGNVGIGTDSPGSKLTVKSGDVLISEAGMGVILKSPDGKRYRLAIDNAGVVAATLIP